MSQGDYIQYKKTQVVLKVQADLPPVLEEQAYTNYAGYSIETTVSNTKTAPNQLQQTGYTTIFGMEKKTTNCPTFIMCNSTNTRPNRIAIYGPMIDPSPANTQPFWVANTESCPLWVKCRDPRLRSNIYTPTTL